MRVLVTRSAEDAAPLVARLAKRDIKTLVEPLMAVRVLSGAPLDLGGVQVLLITSANGVRAFAARNSERDLRVFAVGDASAAAARAAGFRKVESASGDVAALATLVRDYVDPNDGVVLHAAAGDVAGDLGGALSKAGFAYRREVLYRAVPVLALSPATISEFRAHALDGVLLFSPRTAATFVRLAKEADIGDSLTQMRAYCLSDAVATEAGKIPWAAVRAAARPDIGTLIDLVASDT